jgi:transposase-like protein
MDENNVIDIKNLVKDPLTEFLRNSARTMLQMALEQEVADFIESYKNESLENNKRRIVRNGHLPERDIQTGIGNVEVKLPRVRDRGKTEEKIKFCSSWIPKYMRRTKTLESLLPLLYLKGISTGDFQDVLEPILGKNAANLSPSVISRMKASWIDDYKSFNKKDLSLKKYVYFWADGIYLEARGEEEKRCILVIIGANENGKKELVAMTDGFRESKESWLALLRDLRDRGLKSFARLAIGDGALGFWAALSEISPATQWQRCWVHKTRNVLDKLPKSLQAKAKSELHEIYFSPTKKQAEYAFKRFIDNYGAKYPKAKECLEKDHKALLKFYDFPAEHWQSIRTTNPIESTFSIIRHRTVKSKWCFSRDTIMGSVFKLAMEAEKSFRKLYGHNRIADVINLVRFVDGIAEANSNKNENDDHNKIAA